MIRTCVEFSWSVDAPPGAMPIGEVPPSVPEAIRKFSESLREFGLHVSSPTAGETAWSFTCTLQHIRMDCELGWHDEQDWYVASFPRYGLINSVLLRWWENEQEHFTRIVDSVLRTDARVSNIEWYFEDQWHELGWPPKKRQQSFMCPACGSESIQIKRWGHGERRDKSNGWFWYATCDKCNGRCAAWNGDETYIPTTEEWSTWVAASR